MSFGVHDLLLKEILFLFVALGFGLPVLNTILQFLLLPLLPYLVLPDGGNCALQLTYLLILESVVRVLLIEFFNQLPQVLLFLLDIDSVAFHVLVFLLGKNSVQFFIKAVNGSINLTA